MTSAQCSCGFTEDKAGDETITDHLFTAFAPEDDKGTDGLVHVEGKQRLTCLCGLAAATAEELDAHFIALFTPDDAAGRDGKKHRLVSAAANEASDVLQGAGNTR
jgi:hypothetical protein